MNDSLKAGSSRGAISVYRAIGTPCQEGLSVLEI